MTPEERAADTAMTGALLDSGWECRTAFKLDWEDESLLIHVSDIGNTTGVRGEVSYQDGLEGFLAVLVAWQDRVTLENFEELLRDFARNGHDAYWLDGDDATPVRP